MRLRSILAAGDYFIVVRRNWPTWEWEIQRRSKPLDVRLRKSGYESRTSAKFAGEVALKGFLAELIKPINETRH
jgi:hypothetical protein